MSQGEFEREVLDRLITIETQLKTVIAQCPSCQARINALEIATTRIIESVKSSHHRIDGIYKTAGIISTAIALLINVIAFVLTQSARGGF